MATTPTDKDPLVRIAGRRPMDVCAELELDDAARALLTDTLQPAPFLTALIQGEMFTDAVAYLAHALPKPDAVAWACVCVRTALGTAPVDGHIASQIAAAEAWAMQPSARNSRGAEKVALEGRPKDCGAQFAAMAAFWSGESLAPEGLPPVPPAPGLTGTAVATAVTMAAVSGDPMAIPDRYRTYLAKGILIARTPV
ncbi:MAG: hypothetical protein AB7Q97_08520 [Gammaproteobacteria bacterium]